MHKTINCCVLGNEPRVRDISGESNQLLAHVLLWYVKDVELTRLIDLTLLTTELLYLFMTKLFVRSFW